ncbi:MAG: sulfite exporter TauE/SafE family protein [Rhodobacteraceae bacterium]|nr:sulfite exporter TauE/SafE family protein [Paracoccaceae bacterium]
MLFGMGPLALAFMAAVVFASAFVRGYSGFGYPVLVIAAGAFVAHPLWLIPVAVLGDLVLCIQHGRAARPDVHWPTVWRLAAGAVVGLLPGIWVLAQIDEATARIAVSLVVLAASLVMLSGWVLPGHAGPSATLGMGVVSGLAAPAGVAGPPAVMLVAALGLAPLAFRATLLAYFVLLDTMTFAQFGLAGRVDASVLGATALSVPLVVAGSWWGARRAVGADPARFRRITIGVLMAMAAIGLIRAL